MNLWKCCAGLVVVAFTALVPWWAAADGPDGAGAPSPTTPTSAAHTPNAAARALWRATTHARLNPAWTTKDPAASQRARDLLAVSWRTLASGAPEAKPPAALVQVNDSASKAVTAATDGIDKALGAAPTQAQARLAIDAAAEGVESSLDGAQNKRPQPVAEAVSPEPVKAGAEVAVAKNTATQQQPNPGTDKPSVEPAPQKPVENAPKPAVAPVAQPARPDANQQLLLATQKQQVPTESLAKDDLLHDKGTLHPPLIYGELLQGFGFMEESKRSKNLIRHTGWRLQAPSTHRVRCIAPGKVVMAKPYKGFGLMIVVDHGNGYHSVYAHMGTIIVAEGSKVDKATPLGQAGKREGPPISELYFELRKDGIPVDPEGWFASAKELRPR